MYERGRGSVERSILKCKKRWDDGTHSCAQLCTAVRTITTHFGENVRGPDMLSPNVPAIFVC